MSTLSWGSNTITFSNGYTVSIQKDFEKNGDGTPLAEKHTISVRGAVIASGADPETRYSNLLLAASNRADLAYLSRQIGTLTLPGGTTYSNASLVSISSSEPPDDTAGIHYIDINMSFEAYASSNLSTYHIKSSSETVEIRKEEDRHSFSNDDITSNSVFFSYTITHTISATGYLIENEEGYESAKNWVEARFKASSLGIKIEKNSYDDNLYRILDPETDYDLGTIPEEEFNIIKSVSADPASGTYSITTTFFRSKSKSSAEVNVDFSKDDNGDVSVSVNGTVQGLSSGGASATTDNRFSNAEASFSTICGNFSTGSKVFAVAQNSFNNNNTESVVLDDYPLSISIGENKLKGSKNFNVTYRAYPNAVKLLKDAIPDAIVATLSITDDNAAKGHDVQIFAAIPVIGRTEGPILQDMGTTRERRRSVQLDATVKASQRTPINDAVIDACFTEVMKYEPNGTTYRGNSNSSWDFTSGRASVSMEWTYAP